MRKVHYVPAVAFLTMVLTAGSVSSQSVGRPMPSLDDEKAAYTRWGWTWTSSDLPNFPPEPSYTVTNPNVHGDTEGDDLWTYLTQYRRTGQQGYLDRARAWARYMRDDYRQCVGTSDWTYCLDRNVHFLDHVYVGGLIAYSQHTGDPSYRLAAEAICGDIEALWKPAAEGGTGQWSTAVPGVRRMGSDYAMRAFTRNWLALAQCREANPTRWTSIHNRLTDLWVQSPDWMNYGPSGGGFYADRRLTDGCGGVGWDSGNRMQAAFWMGIWAEAAYQTYRLTGRSDVRDKMVGMARFVKDYGLDMSATPRPNTWTYFGVNVNTGQRVHCQGSHYSTISLTNTLVFGSWLTSGAESAALFNRAKDHLDYGTRYVDNTPQGQVSHFLDTVRDSSSGNFFMSYNKGELQYAWGVFAPPANTDAVAPSAPSNLRIP